MLLISILIPVNAAIGGGPIARVAADTRTGTFWILLMEELLTHDGMLAPGVEFTDHPINRELQQTTALLPVNGPSTAISLSHNM